MVFFFFSSRRRHTRFKCDWSSDVCSSDLPFPYPNFSPMNRGSAFESPARVFDFMANPIQLNPTEEIDAFAAAGNFTETAYIAILFTDGSQQVRPAGRPSTAHAPHAATPTA